MRRRVPHTPTRSRSPGLLSPAGRRRGGSGAPSVGAGARREPFRRGGEPRLAARGRGKRGVFWVAARHRRRAHGAAGRDAAGRRRAGTGGLAGPSGGRGSHRARAARRRAARPLRPRRRPAGAAARTGAHLHRVRPRRRRAGRRLARAGSAPMLRRLSPRPEGSRAGRSLRRAPRRDRARRGGRAPSPPRHADRALRRDGGEPPRGAPLRRARGSLQRTGHRPERRRQHAPTTRGGAGCARRALAGRG